MEEKYYEMIQRKDWESLAKISRTSDLAYYQYEGKYLLEYLLERGIHNANLDDTVRYNLDFAKIYLKYNIIEPIFTCSLNVLLKDVGDKIFLDLVLEKLNDGKELDLYERIRFKDYNNYRINERKILECFGRNGIFLPSIFINYTLEDVQYTVRDMDKELIKQFSDIFSDQTKEVLNVYINEIKKRLLMNHDRAVNDIKKLIEYKKNCPKFTLSLSSETEGKYIKNEDRIEISRYSSTIYDHELSHLLFQIFENHRVINDYEDIRKKLDNSKNIAIFQEYLKEFHKKYEAKMKEYEREYYELINVKYDGFDNYLLSLCKDFYYNKKKINFFILNLKLYDLNCYDSLESIKKIVLEFLEIEKKEYITRKTRNYYGPYLMLENMLDAIVMGKICDDLGDECLSGHEGLYFVLKESRSFDECLADFDAIYKSDKSEELLDDLEKLIGKELINFLIKYIEKKREKRYGHR